MVVILSVATSFAERTVTFNFSQLGYANAQAVTEVVQDGVTFTLSKGSGTTAPAYYTSGSALRTYAKNTMEISGGNITKVVFTFTGTSYAFANDATFTPGTYTTSTGTWTGSASSISIVNGASGQVRITKMEVTLGDDEPGIDPDPVPDTTQEVTIDLTKQGYSNSEDVTTVTENDVTLTFSKGSNNNNVPKYYTTGNAVRLYPNNELEVQANGKEIIKIEFTFSGSSYTFSSISSTPEGTYSESGTTGTWTGSGEIVTIKCGKASGHARISAITVTVKSDGSEPDPVTTVANPVFTPSNTSTASAKDITISCETEGAQIYYTLDDTEPDKESTLYTEPIHIATTTTVKAIAYATINGEEVSSEVITATYEIYLNAPKFSVEPGTYAEAQTLTLTAYNDASIYYTVDGTEPTEESILYTEPIAITTNTFIKVIAINGEVKSPVAEGYYIINASSMTATFNFTENTYGYDVSSGNTTYVVSKLTEGDVTINLAVTVNATGEPAQDSQQWRFWNRSSTDHLRSSLNANNSNTMTFTCGHGRKITSIVFNYTSGASYQPKEILASQGTMTGITNWEGAASDVVLTFFKGSGTTEIRGITVSTIESSAPDFSEPGGNFYRPFRLSLTTSIPDAKIYYTLNGTVPTEGSTLFTEPILISATTEGEQITVRAIAVYEDEDGNKHVSEMASATYTYTSPGAEVLSIEEFYEEALKNSGKAILINIPLAVSAVSDKYLYVNDGWPQNKFNSIEIVKNGIKWNDYYKYGSLIPAGTVAELGWSDDGITPTLLLKNDVEESTMWIDKILTDTITGLDLNSIININPEDYPNLVLNEGVDIEMLSKLVCIKDVKFTAATSNTVNQSFTGTTPDGENITFTVRFPIAKYNAGTYDVTGIIGANKKVTVVKPSVDPETGETIEGYNKVTFSVELYPVAIAAKPVETDPTDNVEYEAVTSVTDGKYIIATPDGIVAAALASNKTYGYLPKEEGTVADNVLSLSKDLNCEFTLETAGSSDIFYIRDDAGRYYYQTETYNSFNVSESLPENAEEAEWRISFNADNTATITNVAKAKFIQYSTQYSTWGCYADMQQAGVMPMIFKKAGEPESVTVVEGDNSDAPVEIFSLSGLRLKADNVKELPAGIYVVRQGTKVTKLMVR